MKEACRLTEVSGCAICEKPSRENFFVELPDLPIVAAVAVVFAAPPLLGAFNPAPDFMLAPPGAVPGFGLKRG